MEKTANKKHIGKFATLIIICALLLASLSGCLSSCGLLNGNYLTEFMDELLVSMFSGDAISVNILLNYPELLGIDGGDATLPIPNTSNIDYEESMSSLNEISAFLLNFNYSSLTPTQKCDYDTLMNYFYTRARYADYYYLQDSYLGSSGGINVSLPLYLDKYELRTKKDIENWLSLVEQPFTVFPQYITFEQSRIDAGYGRGDFVYTGIAEQAEEMATVANGSTHFIIGLFADKLSACSFLTEEERNTYQTRCTTAVNTKFIPAYQTLAREIVMFVGNKNNNNNGLCYYTDGSSYYELLFSDYASSSDSVTTAYQNLATAYNSALTKTQTIYAELAALGIEREEIPDAMNVFTSNAHLTKSELEQYYSSLQTAYSADFPSLPSSIPSVTFNEVPAVMSNFYNPASYFKSALDNPSGEESVYINISNAGDNLGFSLISHEGIPGHQLQHSFYKTSGAHMLRSVLGYTGYMEGWATYAQYYSIKYYEDSDINKLLFKLYLLNDELTLYMITLMDMDVNYFGLTKAELVADYSAYGLSKVGIENTFEYVAENPAVYTSYGYGYYKMNALRAGYAGSDIAFHTAVLSVGPTTYEILAKFI